MANQIRSQRPSQALEEKRIPQVSLNDLPAGRSGIVSHLDGEKELVNRILSLGFAIGAYVTVLDNQRQGPIVVSVLGAHFALGRQEADLIRVQPV